MKHRYLRFHRHNFHTLKIFANVSLNGVKFVRVYFFYHQILRCLSVNSSHFPGSNFDLVFVAVKF
jgi:hypothetical protein